MENFNEVNQNFPQYERMTVYSTSVKAITSRYEVNRYDSDHSRRHNKFILVQLQLESTAKQWLPP